MDERLGRGKKLGHPRRLNRLLRFSTQEIEMSVFHEVWSDGRHSIKQRFKILTIIGDRIIRRRLFGGIFSVENSGRVCTYSSDSLSILSRVGIKQQEMERIPKGNGNGHQTGIPKHPVESKRCDQNITPTHFHASVNFPLFWSEDSETFMRCQRISFCQSIYFYNVVCSTTSSSLKII